MVIHPKTGQLIVRWAVFMPPHKAGLIEAKGFTSEKDRDEWVRENPGIREAVGKRHPAVKALRQRCDAKEDSCSPTKT